MSSDFALIANGDNARYYATVLKDGEILNINIEDFKYQGAINVDDNTLIGNTCSSNVSFSIYNPLITLENKEIEIKQGLMINGSLENIKLGYFKIQKPTSDGEVTKYIGYDRMSLFEKPYFSSLTYPITTDKIINEICTMVGVEFNTTLTVSYTISKKPEGYTCREMIGYLAALYGSNATINREGQLEFVWCKEVDYIVDGSKYYDNGINISSENDFILKKITCTVPSGDNKETFTVGNGQGISIENPLMTQSILYNIFYSKLNFFNYRAMSVKFLGDFRLDLGDIIKVKKGEKTYTLPIMQIEHECDGGVITTITSFAKTESEQEFDVKGPNTKAMERYYAELVMINEAMINKLDADVAEITYATISELNVTNEAVIKKLNSADAEILYAKITDLDVEKAKINNIEAKMLTADSAVIKTIQTDVADINTLIFGSATGTVIQTEFANSVIAQLGNAQIKNAMIDSISAGKITSGKLYTNLVEITSQSGNIGIKDNTFKITDDNSTVRVQIGKDASNDYNMYVWDASGNLMFDALGLTEKGIQREIIRNDMVSENANISASKLDIESLFDVINEDGSHTLKSSKIYVDADNQTLDVSFKTMTTNISSASTIANNALNKANTNATNISVMQGQISSKIWQQDISTAVDSIEIGGRNLASINDSIEGKRIALSTYYPGASDTAHRITKLIPAIVGEQFTISTLAEGVITIGFFNSENYCISRPDGYVSRESGWYGTYTAPDNTAFIALSWEKAIDGNVKLEKGNKKTDYTPAPEDVENEISVLSTKYTDISQTVDGISATVASHTTQIATKADNTAVAQIQSNVTELTADINGFKTTVSSTYTTKAEFNDLEVGGRNYIINSNFQNGFDNWYLYATGSNVTYEILEDIAYGHLCKVISDRKDRGISVSSNNMPNIEAGTELVYSIYAKADSEMTVYLATNDSGIASANSYQINTEWQRIVMKTTQTGTNFGIRIYGLGTYYVTNVKLEIGNMVTDWSPAPEDVENEISTVETHISSVEQTADKINWLVKNGTSSSDFTLTDRLAELTAEIISLNGNVKVSGSMIVDGAVTASKIATNAIKSRNYSKDTAGSYLNLANGSFDSKNLKWDEYGNLSAESANISGNIKANEGQIGGWTIYDSGELISELKTQGTLNTVVFRPIRKDDYEDTWMLASYYQDIDSSGQVSPKPKLYWYIRAGGQFYTRDDFWTDGQFFSTGNIYPQIYGNGDYLHLAAVNNSISGAVLSNVDGDVAFRPATDNKPNLGHSTKRWRNIYASTSTIITSDRNQKKAIEELSDEITRAFMKGLIPCSYKLKDGTSGRTHTGLIAQDVERLLNELGIDTLNFAGFIKSPRTKEIEETALDEEGNPIIDENGNTKSKVRVEVIEGEYDYALRYEEFIAPIIKMLQMHEESLTDVNDRLDFITDLIQHLIGLVMGSIQSEDI